MKRSLLSLSPIISSVRSYSVPLSHGSWLHPRVCTSARSLRTCALQQPPLRTSLSQKHSFLSFAAGTLLRANIRSGLNRGSRGGRHGGYGGPKGPWQRLRDRINAIPGNALFWGIIGLNGAVFLSWQWAWAAYKSAGDASSYIWMRDHFVASADNLKAGRWYTVLTSCFSHEDTAHIMFNGFTYYFMAPLVISILGNVGFLGLYLGGGVVSSLVGIVWRNHKQGNQKPGAHGASGALYSVVSFFACLAPTATFYLFGIIPVPAWAFVTGIFLWDGYSAMYDKRAGTDTAGHVGGLLAGIGYFIAKRFRIF